MRGFMNEFFLDAVGSTIRTASSTFYRKAFSNKFVVCNFD